ncbi:unnamed protein product [Arabidopsis lyrata]|nr:unnamed protein product [Arabidopsis lyrata]
MVSDWIYEIRWLLSPANPAFTVSFVRLSFWPARLLKRACSAFLRHRSAYSAKLAGFISDVLVAISSGEFDRLWFLVYGLNRR